MPNVELEREALRFVAVRATKNGTPVVASEYAKVAYNIRPEQIPDDAWTALETKGPDVGFYVGPDIAAGSYAIYARWTDGTETPVQFAGILVQR